jgi:type IV pilus assembly protein PilW
MRQTMHTLMRRAQRGVSLIEVLVAVAIGMIGILIMTQAYLTSDEFNKATLGAGGAQTNGNVALFTIEREARMAGYGMNSASALECGNINWYYNGDYSGNLGGSLPNVELAPVVISSAPNTPDTITIMYATGEQRVTPGTLSKTMPNASSVLDVDGTSGFNDNDMVLLVNKTPPISCTLVQLTSILTGSSKLQHNPGGAAPYNPPGAGAFPAYSKNDSVFNLGNPIVRSYSVANDSLRVSEVFLNAATPGSGTFDLVDGIVDMRALYGKDTNGDDVVDAYDNVKPTTAAGWLQVLSLRIAVVARVGNYERPTGANCDATTANPTWTYENPVGTPQTATFNWTDLTDVTNQARCYRYRVFETTVPLRNIIWRYV